MAGFETKNDMELSIVVLAVLVAVYDVIYALSRILCLLLAGDWI